MLAYLADIFDCLNNLNSSFLGDCIKIFTLHNTTNAFQKMQVFWNVSVLKGNMNIFLCLQNLLRSASINKKVIFFNESALRRAGG